MLKSILIFLLPILLLLRPTHCRTPHVINFRWPNLYPEAFAWDPKSDHFILSSLRQPLLISVSDAAVSSSLVVDDSLPSNSSFLGIAIDPRKRRLLTVVHIGSSSLSPPRSALAAYDLNTFRRLLLVPLDDLLPSPVLANDVAADYDGNAYVTDSTNNVVFKITEQGQPSILSDAKIFKPDTVDVTVPYHKCGLNGVVYNSKGYLLVTQSNTGKLFKVNVDDGTTRRVLLNRNLTAADGIAVRKDGVVLVVSQNKMYFVKSDDSWSEGVVFDETALEEEGEASAVVVGAESRVYALYGRVNEGIMGNSRREEYSIVQVESEEENKEEKIWIYVLVGLGLFWLMLWRFQMKKLVINMDKKMS